MELAGAAAQVGLLSEALGCKPVVVAGSAAGLATVALTLGAPTGAGRAWLQAGQVTVAFAFASHAAFAALVFGCVQRSQYRLGAHGSKAAALAGICVSALAGQLLRQQLGLDLLFLLSLLSQLAALGVALSLAASAGDISAADVATNTDEPGASGGPTSTASRLLSLLKTWAADMAAAVRVTGVGGWTWWALGSGAVHRSSLTYWQALVKVVARQDVSREVNGYFSAAMYALAAAFTGTSVSAPLEHYRMALQMGSPCVHEVTAAACSAQVAMEVKLADVMASSHALHRSRSPPERRLAALFASTAALSVLLEITLQAALRQSATSLPQRFEAMAAALLVLGGTLALPPLGAADGKRHLRVRLYLGDPDAPEAAAAGPRPLDPAVAARNRARLDLTRATLSLTQDLPCHLLRLCNLATISREFAALSSAAALPFFPTILAGGMAPPFAGGSRLALPEPLWQHLKSTHNASQLLAIEAGLSDDPIVLIQGPPGTGKTQTILGLLSAVLHAKPARQLPSRLEHWHKASPWLCGVNARDKVMPTDMADEDPMATPSLFADKAELLAAVQRQRAHVLLCAPSNAALDELVLRLLSSGLHDENGVRYAPSIVRVGINAHNFVEAVTMDTLVAQKLASAEKSLVSSRTGSAGMERDRIRIAILDQAAIVCSTLSYSGSGLFARMTRAFDIVIVDEAAQAVEPATLVPLSHGCRQVILVGDPVQLPATVLSRRAMDYGYATSLFSRFQEGGYPVQMLTVQYRMHQDIREFPSAEFYGGSLVDGEGVTAATKRAWHCYPCFGPLAFLDVWAGVEEQPGGTGSWVNRDEAALVLELYQVLVQQYGCRSVAIISPYKQQVLYLRALFGKKLGGVENVEKLVDINTVDGFQGREKDVAIISAVRTTNSGRIGFLQDFRRMNVALTRARASMLVVGCSRALQRDAHWASLVHHARSRGRLFRVPKPSRAFFTEGALEQLRLHHSSFLALKEAKVAAAEKAVTGASEGAAPGTMQQLLIENTSEEQGEAMLVDLVDDGNLSTQAGGEVIIEDDDDDEMAKEAVANLGDLDEDIIVSGVAGDAEVTDPGLGTEL
eukprot:SM000140S00634  [mRNA]  locus=s140:272814:280016:- [translate_table: standard]